MSISFKITKVNDSSNKPTVFERLGMKSSKKESKEKKTGRDKDIGFDKRSCRTKDEEKSKDKTESKVSIDKSKSREHKERTDKNSEEEKKKSMLQRPSKEEGKKRKNTGEMKDSQKGHVVERKKRRHASTSSRSSRSSQRTAPKHLRKKAREASDKKERVKSPSCIKSASKSRGSPNHPHKMTFTMKEAEEADKGEYISRRKTDDGRELWHRKEDRCSDASRYKSEQRWSEDGFSPSRSRDREDRTFMDSKLPRKTNRRSEERYLEIDSFGIYKKDMTVSQTSPVKAYRSKHEGDKGGYHAKELSPRSYDLHDLHAGRGLEAYKDRRSRSKSGRESRYYDKMPMMPRSRVPSLLPSHLPGLQPLLPPPSSYDFHFSLPRPSSHSDIQSPNKLLTLGKNALHHGGEFWEGRRMGGGGLLSGMSLPQFRAPMPHTPYRMSMHNFPISDFKPRFETRMPLPMATPMRAPSPNGEQNSKMIIKTPFHQHALLPNESVSAGSGVTKEGLKGFSLACYEAVSDADLEDETLGVDDSEESTLSGLEEGDNVALIDKSIFSLPKKISLVETSDVDWSMLFRSGMRDISTPRVTSTNPFDEIGLSKKLSGCELYEAVKVSMTSDSKSIKSLSDDASNADAAEEPSHKTETSMNEDSGKTTDVKSDPLDQIALYEVHRSNRSKRMQEVVGLLGGLQQALSARKDLFIRRILCHLSKEEEVVFPGLGHESDIYRKAVSLFKS